jgi:hypothetical protein
MEWIFTTFQSNKKVPKRILLIKKFSSSSSTSYNWSLIFIRCLVFVGVIQNVHGYCTLMWFVSRRQTKAQLVNYLNLLHDPSTRTSILPGNWHLKTDSFHDLAHRPIAFSSKAHGLAWTYICVISLPLEHHHPRQVPAKQSNKVSTW